MEKRTIFLKTAIAICLVFSIGVLILIAMATARIAITSNNWMDFIDNLIDVKMIALLALGSVSVIIGHHFCDAIIQKEGKGGTKKEVNA